MPDQTPTLEIAMAVYGGEHGGYLEQQLKTLFAQTNQAWRLLVRDDASPDRTLDILRAWRERYPERIVIIDENEPRRLGFCGNFSRVLEVTQAQYVMLCDQDDLWYPDKVERAVQAMLKLEDQFGYDTPLLSHTDLRPVDGSLHIIAPSFWALYRFSPRHYRSFGSVCLETVISGMASIFNRALIQKAGKIPPEAVFHDGWLEITAAAFGYVEARPEISADYRRHTSNASPSPRSILFMLLRILKNPIAWRRGYWLRREPKLSLAKAFFERFRDDLSTPDRQAAQAMAEFRQKNFWQRRHAIIKHRLFYSSPLYTLAFFILA
ncbi:glycosyltransferase [Acidocella sp.]|uniref:glycosyltransferase n=1 Tax=Acidocella sp. TaxID=50710 RepID=UPI0026147C66|nr:glycosyltransferase [Acidocella sp.]